jgi:hypothetical protein
VRATWQVHELVGWWVGGWGAALTTFCLGSWSCIWWWSLREILNFCEDNFFSRTWNSRMMAVWEVYWAICLIATTNESL